MRRFATKLASIPVATVAMTSIASAGGGGGGEPVSAFLYGLQVVGELVHKLAGMF